ncbi:hypothetical protein HK097_003495, partial [Rhizophlyctis rosea]
MFAAIKNRDLGTLRSLLSSHHSSTTTSADQPQLSTSAGSAGNSSSYLSKRPRIIDLNERDLEGNTPLLFAVSLGNVDIVETLLKDRRVNVNAQDLESGWTALHRALYNGALSLSLTILRLRKDCDLSIRDKEGNTCLFLLNSTIDQIKPNQSRERVELEDEDEGSDDERVSDRRSGGVDKPKRELPPATSVWTWGSNSNYILGHQNSDDRAYPERVDFTTSQRNHPNSVSLHTLSEHDPPVKSVVFSKYHSMIVTPHRIYASGFGPGGRLGLGHEETTLRPTVVKGFSGSVRSVALGPDHSVLVTEQGEVWTWGSNRFGQLGYATDVVGTEAAPELSPREVIALKRNRVLEAAASKMHTAVFTDSGTIYSWGTNVGQLGYTQPINTTQLIPKKITSFPQQTLLSITCTPSSTLVLTTTHEVHIFSNFTSSRVLFPFSPSTSLHHHPSQKPLNFHTPHSQKQKPPYIRKIVGGNHLYAGLTSGGDVFLWSPPAPEGVGGEEFWQQRVFPMKSPRRVWMGRGGHLRARDVAIGIDGNLIIGTEGGRVFVGVRRKEGKAGKGGAGGAGEGLFKWNS